MGGKCGAFEERREMHAGLCWLNTRGRNYMEDLEVEGSIILN
jgi:hypothetical protein